MKSRFEDRWSSAADDGASCLAGVTMTRASDDAEVGQLLDAWYRERTERIECSLVLEQARRLIAGLVAEDGIAPERRRQADRLLRSIRNVQKREQRP